MIDLRTSEEWNQVKLHKIMDPDGWDRGNFNWSWYEQRITEDEFDARVLKSTVLVGWDSISTLGTNPCREISMLATKPRFTSSVLHGSTAGVYPNIPTGSIKKESIFS